MAQTTYFVDTENVGCRWSSLLSECKQTDKFVLIYTKKSPPLPMELFAQITYARRKVECVVSDQGSNALDFTLVTELGRRVERDSTKKVKQSYVIVSNDKGYDAAISHLTRQGIEVTRLELPPAKSSPKTITLPVEYTGDDSYSEPSSGTSLTNVTEQAKEGELLIAYRNVMQQYPGVKETDIVICSHYMMEAMSHNSPAKRRDALHRNLVTYFGGAVKQADDIYGRVKKAIKFIAENGPFPQGTCHGAA